MTFTSYGPSVKSAAPPARWIRRGRSLPGRVGQMRPGSSRGQAVPRLIPTELRPAGHPVAPKLPGPVTVRGKSPQRSIVCNAVWRRTGTRRRRPPAVQSTGCKTGTARCQTAMFVLQARVELPVMALVRQEGKGVRSSKPRPQRPCPGMRCWLSRLALFCQSQQSTVTVDLSLIGSPPWDLLVFIKPLVFMVIILFYCYIARFDRQWNHFPGSSQSTRCIYIRVWIRLKFAELFCIPTSSIPRVSGLASLACQNNSLPNHVPSRHNRSRINRAG